ncbi:MAG TPA: hypothetical protein VGR98_07405, partial [Streptosporangiaceae bacterium]|nr:hypothetical protein [Streptosporangiaceae bacterium]
AVTAPPSGNGSPAPAAPAQKATAAAAPVRQDAPAGQHAAPGRPDAPTQAAPAKQSATGKGGKGDDQEWWQE